MDEIWKDIPGYEGLYQVSDRGRVKSIARKISNGYAMVDRPERLLLPNTLAKGYFQVTLYNVISRKCFQVHRLVAMAFIPNPQGYPQINHINGNKQDNRKENLEWCDNRQNQLHAWKIGLQRPHFSGGGAPKKKVALLREDGSVERVFDSIRAAASFFGVNQPANLSHCLNGKHGHKTFQGREFKFI